MVERTEENSIGQHQVEQIRGGPKFLVGTKVINMYIYLF